MSSKNSKKSIKKATWDYEKDNIFKELAAFLQTTGFSVRREDLKQGHGWKAMSGTCRHETQKLIFVDRKLPQDEQISFLVHKINELKLKISDELRAKLPEKMLVLFQPSSDREAA